MPDVLRVHLSIQTDICIWTCRIFWQLIKCFIFEAFWCLFVVLSNDPLMFSRRWLHAGMQSLWKTKEGKLFLLFVFLCFIYVHKWQMVHYLCVAFFVHLPQAHFFPLGWRFWHFCPSDCSTLVEEVMSFLKDSDSFYCLSVCCHYTAMLALEIPLVTPHRNNTTLFNSGKTLTLGSVM